MKKKLIIYGASGHGKVAADIAKLNGYEDIIFYDDDQVKNKFGPFQVIHVFPEEKDYDLFIAIGDNKTRELISKRFDDIVTLIHPSAVIGEDVTLGNGVIVMANAVINPGTVIGDGTIINTCSSIDHDNIIGKYNHFSVASHSAGTVITGDRVFAGIGAVIVNNVSICDDVLIGAGGVVIDDIKEKGTYIGVPVKKK
ncbi:MAG: acetyltransferase [Erysipelotrichaceae bacterium]|nr:acetyltransferase [Erysipelotrichaceae bacterium]